MLNESECNKARRKRMYRRVSREAKDRVVKTHFSKFDMQEVTWKCNITICSVVCMWARFRTELGYPLQSLEHWMENVFIKAYPDTYGVYDHRERVFTFFGYLHTFIFGLLFPSFRFLLGKRRCIYAPILPHTHIKFELWKKN